MSTYCQAIENMKEADQSVHKHYHDFKYGFPIENDDELFCRLILEINQAGLSWTTILKKETNFRQAFHNFKIEKVASYNEKDVQRLLKDAGIIRNRLKIAAAIHNANVIKSLQKEYGSFSKWLHKNHPLTKDEWTRLFKKTFRFTGGEIVNEFLVSTGFLPGAHHEKCKIYKQVLKHKPAWKSTGKK
ncbi:MAG TPA: DNA-3-methyladenine glycosylase I [Bacteroidia bacterium]|nr:DNA-3-methyladenine glycosylase I [Bacteroidia bacterium]